VRKLLFLDFDEEHNPEKLVQLEDPTFVSFPSTIYALPINLTMSFRVENSSRVAVHGDYQGDDSLPRLGDHGFSNDQFGNFDHRLNIRMAFAPKECPRPTKFLLRKSTLKPASCPDERNRCTARA